MLQLLLLSLFQIVASENDGNYDFVIVGGGTAGCTLAARLCTDLPTASVALLERGAPRTAEQGFVQQAAHNVYRTWDTSEGLVEAWQSQINSALLQANAITGTPILSDSTGEYRFGRTADILTGATLGGTSSINAGQWTIPQPGDVESWGIGGLNNSMTVEAYFAKAAKVLQISVPTITANYTQDWLDAARRTGFEVIPGATNSVPYELDQVAETNDAFDVNTGRRRDACTAYLQPALAGSCAKTLTLIQNATVTKLVIDDDKNKIAKKSVSSIEYIQGDGTTAAISARLQVILSAGPYGSPKLLQLSGIGPPSVLQAAAFEPVVDLPVGLGTQARPVAFVSTLYTKPLDFTNDPSLLQETARQQFERGEGGVYAAFNSATGTVEQGYLETLFSLPQAGTGLPLFFSGCFLNPTSRGNLTIVDADPYTPPKVFQNLLGTQDEQEAMVTCLERLQSVVSAFPDDFGANVIQPSAQQSMEEYVLAGTSNGYHFVGGRAVGRVVNGDDFGVFGFDNLLVVDASVIPKLPRSAGPMSSVYMIAGYAADQIIQKSLDFFSATNTPEETETPSTAVPVSKQPVTTSIQPVPFSGSSGKKRGMGYSSGATPTGAGVPKAGKKTGGAN